MRVAGIMSGTSLDGIDVAIVDIKGRIIRTVAHSTTPYPQATRQRILNVPLAVSAAGDLSRLNFELGELYAKAVKSACQRFKIPLDSIHLIGCHGQTIYHEGGKNTLQIGEAAVIAERLNIPVVSDFRTRDIAAGGQGAPLVPFADTLLFSSTKRNRVALNIGGIANITVLSGAPAADQVIAFDTGPGNMVIDQLVNAPAGASIETEPSPQKAASTARCSTPCSATPITKRTPRKPPAANSMGRHLSTACAHRTCRWKTSSPRQPP